MSAINDALKGVLNFIYSIVANYGWSIVIFTILVKFVLLPLEIKSRKGMRKMQRIQPQINALQKKYANDKQKLQQKQSELMKKEGYSPLSGCLPMLIQLPVLFAMFAAMRGIANDQIVAQVFDYLAGHEPSFERWLWVSNIWMPDSLFATMVPDINTIKMITSDVWANVFRGLDPEKVRLIAANMMEKLPEFAGLSQESFISKAALDGVLPNILTVMQGMPLYMAKLQPLEGWANLNFFLFSITVYQHYNGYLILPALAGASQVLMTKLNPTASPTGQPAGGQASAGQAAGMGGFMKYFFPLFSVFICLTSNAGFAMYWVVSNLVATLQSVFITRYFDRADKLAAEAKGEVSLT